MNDSSIQSWAFRKHVLVQNSSIIYADLLTYGSNTPYNSLIKARLAVKAYFCIATLCFSASAWVLSWFFH